MAGTDEPTVVSIRLLDGSSAVPENKDFFFFQICRSFQMIMMFITMMARSGIILMTMLLTAIHVGHHPLSVIAETSTKLQQSLSSGASSLVLFEQSLISYLKKFGTSIMALKPYAKRICRTIGRGSVFLSWDPFKCTWRIGF